MSVIKHKELNKNLKAFAAGAAPGIFLIHGEELLTHESMLMEVERRGEAAGLLKKGDLLVITAGFPVGGPGSTNTVTVKTVGEQLIGASP